MRNLLTLLVLSVALSGLANAQTSSKAVVNVDGAGPSAPVSPGSTFEATITLGIKGGYHINANKPSEDFLIGTSVKFTPPEGVKVVGTSYPSAKYAKFDFSEVPLAVYEGTARITLKLQADKTATGALSVPGKVTFQACNDAQCLPPSTVDVAIPFEVAAVGGADTGAGLENTNSALQKPSFTLNGAPPSARVLVDNREVGKTNAQGKYVAHDVKAGRHKVRVEAEGYKMWEQSVDVNPLVPQTINVTMEKDPNASAVPAIQSPTVPGLNPELPKPQGEPAKPAEPEKSSTGNVLYYVIAAIGLFVVVGGGLAAALLGRPK